MGEITKRIRIKFREAVSRNDDAIDLGEAALLIAAEEYPRLDLNSYLKQLDRIGVRAGTLASNAGGPVDSIIALNTVLFDELGFRGNTVNYYDPRNSYLNEVLNRRTGIPITLTIVYMEVARRIGFTTEGVGLPGHFIAKHVDDKGQIFIDPFNCGRVLGEAACADLVAGTTGGKASLRPEHLAAVSKKQILTRMLSNILAIYSNSSDYERSLAAIDRILIINPDSAPHIRDRGLLLAALHRPTAALEQLARYLALTPEAPDTAGVRQQINSIKQDQAKLN